jgi:hypothetical protein
MDIQALVAIDKDFVVPSLVAELIDRDFVDRDQASWDFELEIDHRELLVVVLALVDNPLQMLAVACLVVALEDSLIQMELMDNRLALESHLARKLQ